MRFANNVKMNMNILQIKATYQLNKKLEQIKIKIRYKKQMINGKFCSVRNFISIFTLKIINNTKKIRTFILRFWRPLLYQLSYRAMFSIGGRVRTFTRGAKILCAAITPHR